MFTVLIIIHVIICIGLIAMILLQPGQGQGLSDTLGGGMAESVLGSNASSLLTKATTVFAILFFIVCLSVTVLSVKKGRSLIKEEKNVKTEDATSENPKTQPSNK